MVVSRMIYGKARALARTIRDGAYTATTDLRVLLLDCSRVFGASRAVRKRVLFVDEMLPDPRLGAGFPRAAEIVDAMIAAGWDVTHYAKTSTAGQRRAMHERFGGRVDFLPSRGALGLQRVLRERSHSFEALFVSRTSTMKTLVEAHRRSRVRLPFVIYDAESIFSERDVARLALSGQHLTQDQRERLLRAEIALTRISDAIVTVSDTDAATFRRHSGLPVSVVAHAISAADRPAGIERRREIMIVGKVDGPREASPNLDSILWYVEEVAPILQREYGITVPLTIVGWVSEEAKALLANAPVRLAGIVDDLASVYNRARILVAPTRFSAGIPLKVVEAAAAAVPCVVTERVGQQIGFVDQVHARVAGDAASFARACAELYCDDEQWHRIRAAALADVGDRFARARLRSAIARVMDMAVEHPESVTRLAASHRREPIMPLATAA